MLRNFFTITLRSFARQRLYSVINVVGLSSGLLCVLFIYLWVTDEVAKDKFHSESEQIYRVVSNLSFTEGELITWESTPGPLAEDILSNIPEVEMGVRTSNGEDMLLEYDGAKFVEAGLMADPDFFKLFSFKTLIGKPATDAKNTSVISISDKLAAKLFGSNEKAIGKIIKINNQETYNVISVFERPGSESSLVFDFVLPYEIYVKNRGEGFNWGNFDHPLYLKIAPSKLHDAMTKINDRAEKRAEADSDDTPIKYYLQPFEDAYLYSRFENGVPNGGRIEYVRIFTVVGIFMLAIACINFTNMATARAAYRAKEVGIRKVIGAYRRSLISQFILESVMVTFLSMLMAIGFGYMLLPAFNTLVEKTIVLDLTNPKLILSILLIVIVAGVMAGSYPALFLSSYQPAQVLKGTLSQRFSGTSLRKLLVVFQFVLTVILIASSIVIYSQIEFIRNKNLGYDRESVITFSALENISPQFDAFRNDMAQIPGVISVGKANESLVQVNNQNSSVTWPGSDDKNRPFFRTVVADYGYLETMGIKLKEGRLFSRAHNDTSNFVLSERAVEIMGLQNPIGARITQWGMEGEVIGVAENLHARSLHEAMDPIIFFCKPEWTGRVFIRLSSEQTGQTIPKVEEVFKKYCAEYPFIYSFLDDDFEKLYKTEKVTGTLALTFTFLAIIISGLGLLGLAAYTAEKRKKEISIRKTLGATISGIVALVSKDFIKLSAIAAAVGCPIAFFLMDQFLSSYAFHTELDWKIFAITAFGVTLICMLTVLFQVVRAALANPVDALRNE